MVLDAQRREALARCRLWLDRTPKYLIMLNHGGSTTAPDEQHRAGAEVRHGLREGRFRELDGPLLAELGDRGGERFGR